MSRYKLEYKKKYKSSLNAPLDIIEYQVYNYGEENSRFIMTTLRNNTTSTITKAKFSITEFNDKGESLRKASYLFEQLDIGGQSTIIPLLKIKITENCSTIRTKLEEASFENQVWKEESAKEIEEDELRMKAFSFPFWVSFIILIACILTILVLF